MEEQVREFYQGSNKDEILLYKLGKSVRVYFTKDPGGMLTYLKDQAFLRELVRREEISWEDLKRGYTGMGDKGPGTVLRIILGNEISEDPLLNSYNIQPFEIKENYKNLLGILEDIIFDKPVSERIITREELEKEIESVRKEDKFFLEL